VRRSDCLAAIYPELESRVVVSIMGSLAIELYELGHRPNFFYQQHGMGLASSVGLGIALGRPDLDVVVLDGDGSVLMNMGGLTTLARYAPPNLTHVIFDNESLLSVGGFPTATSAGADLAAVARGAGIARVDGVDTLDGFVEAFRSAVSDGALSTVVAKVEAMLPPTFHMDLHLLENRFEFARALRRDAR
jgi:sulfopyruvate decarboxylase subunit beta